MSGLKLIYPEVFNLPKVIYLPHEFEDIASVERNDRLIEILKALKFVGVFKIRDKYEKTGKSQYWRYTFDYRSARPIQRGTILVLS